MAQLPPKIPTVVTPNWPEFPLQKLPHHPFMAVTGPHNATAAGNNINPSWVDEFLDFSSARRGAHRRSASDSIAFLEAPLLDHRRGAAPGDDGGGGDFDRFEDDQFMSMFTDEISPAVVVIPAVSSPNDPSSSPSDRNSINEEKQRTSPNQPQQQHHHHPPQLKNEPEEAQSPCKSDSQAAADTNNGTINPTAERIVDPKRVKRILANRQSAQRSRVRKLQYISELERSVSTLQAEVSVLSPRVAFLDHQRLLLNVDNSALKQRIAALAQDKIFKDAHQDALKREIERLRQVYHQQNMHKMDNNGGTTDEDDDNDNNAAKNGAAAVSVSPPQASSEHDNPNPTPPTPPQMEKEHVLNA
ncbi:hypothetical protein MLD38_033322 [Melastoma candidum]|uniref:Uncharacterized protein n=1 Tax=Melastoma candidum TaxID=119954 RepID=A0ACB9MAP7_9MYRT|nr:hypothetical protein MLD38_033322 [Melastoma candidum]